MYISIKIILCYSLYRYKPFVRGVFQQGALRACGNVGQFSEPVGAGGAAELLVRHAGSHLEEPWRSLILLYLLQIWHVICGEVNISD